MRSRRSPTVGPGRDARARSATSARLVEATGTIGGALDDLKDRLADPVADRIVETLRMSRDVGGTELPTILRSLAASLRQDAAVRVRGRGAPVVGA